MSEHNYKVGDKVRYLDASRHLTEPEYYPAPGTVGTIVEIGDNATCLVQWPEGTTSGGDKWWSMEKKLEPVEVDDEAKEGGQ